MKVKVANYTFNAALKKITFGDYTSISLDSILLITNVTDNLIIYNFADSTVGGTVSENILTLAYDTTSMSNTDKLMIYYDDVNIAAKDSSLVALQNQTDLLKRIVKLLESSATVDINNRQRVAVEAMPTTTVSSSLGAYVQNAGSANPFTATNAFPLTVNEGPVDQRWRIIDAARTAFADGLRRNIT